MWGGGGVGYAAFPLPSEGREVVFDRPSAQVKHIRNKYGKEIQQ